VPLVVDASALAVVLLSSERPGRALRSRLISETNHAPHLIDAEIGNLLRRRVLRYELRADDAGTLLATAAALIDVRHAMTGPLARAAWDLRSNLTFYDAVYVALATALQCNLLTGDRRLSDAPGLPCPVEFVGGS
jgi:predicted nucleic acid-binding protein